MEVADFVCPGERKVQKISNKGILSMNTFSLYLSIAVTNLGFR